MSSKIVLLTRRIAPQAEERLRKSVTLKVWPEDRPCDRAALLSMLTGCHGLLCMLTDKIDQELLDAASSLEVVSTMSVGHDHIDKSACASRNIAIGNTPGVLTDATADLALTLLLATARRVPESVAAVKDGNWGAWAPQWLLGVGLSGKTVGIVGLGRIGLAVAQRLRAFNIGDLLYTSRRDGPNDAASSVGATCTSMSDLLARSDFVVCACALTPDTEGLVNAAFLQQMRPSAILVNISRGAIVDQDALVHALTSGEIRAAGLDVCTPEPLPTDHPLLRLPNCVVLPHIGSATEETRLAMAEIAVDNVIAGIEGRPLRSSVVL